MAPASGWLRLRFLSSDTPWVSARGFEIVVDLDLDLTAGDADPHRMACATTRLAQLPTAVDGIVLHSSPQMFYSAAPSRQEVAAKYQNFITFLSDVINRNFQNILIFYQKVN